MYIVGTLTPFIGRLKRRKKLQPLLITAYRTSPVVYILHILNGIHIARLNGIHMVYILRNKV